MTQPKKKEQSKPRALTKKEIQGFSNELKEAEKKVTALRRKLNLPRPAFPRGSDEREAAFLNNPHLCPFCASPDIVCDGDWDGGAYDTSSKNSCDKCHATWREIYSIVGACDFEEGYENAEETVEEKAACQDHPVDPSSPEGSAPVGGEGSPQVAEDLGAVPSAPSAPEAPDADVPSA